MLRQREEYKANGYHYKLISWVPITENLVIAMYRGICIYDKCLEVVVLRKRKINKTYQQGLAHSEYYWKVPTNEEFGLYGWSFPDCKRELADQRFKEKIEKYSKKYAHST